MNRRIAIIGIFSAIFFLGGFVLYRIFFVSSLPVAELSPTPTPFPVLRPALRAAKTIVALSKTRAVPMLHAKRGGSLLFYTAEGAWEARPGETETRLISAVALAGLTRAVWSPSGERVLTVREQTDGNPVQSLYNYITTKTRALTSGTGALVFSPDSNRVAFQEKDDGRNINQIVTTAVGGEDAKILLKTRVGFWRLFWSQPEQLYVVSQPSGLAQGTAFRINPADGSLAKVLSANALIINPSPTGKKLLYSRADSSGKNLSLFMLDAARARQQNLTQEFKIETLAEKCAWAPDDRTILCAAFNRSPKDALMPDDYYKGVFTSPESLIMVNLDANEKTEVELGGAYDITHPVVNSTEDWLFFINRADGLLYGVELPGNL